MLTTIKEINFIDENPMKTVIWALSKKCNYCCSYCCASKVNDRDNIEKILYLINKFNDDLQIILYGGEPTIFPKFEYILNNIDKRHQIKILTNGSRTIEWWDRIIKQYKNIKKISISIHFEFLSNIDEIIEKIYFLKDFCDIDIKILIKTDKEKKLSTEIKKKICFSDNIKIIEIPIRDPNNFNIFLINQKNLDEIDEDKTVNICLLDGKNYKITRTEFSKLKINFFLCLCTFTDEVCYIQQDGNIFRCVDDMQKNKFFNISAIESLEEIFKKTVCLNKTCTCNFAGSRFFKKNISCENINVS